jgi:hypothetical protein
VRDLIRRMSFESPLWGATRSPWQNGYVERLIGSVRRECTNHLIVFNAEHLRRILLKYARYYNEVRTHVSLGKDAPTRAPSSDMETSSRIRSLEGYTIDTRGSSFRKRHPTSQSIGAVPSSSGWARRPARTVTAPSLLVASGAEWYSGAGVTSGPLGEGRDEHHSDLDCGHGRPVVRR